MMAITCRTPETVRARQEALARYWAAHDAGQLPPSNLRLEPKPLHVASRASNVQRLPRRFLLRVLDWLKP